MKTSFPKSDIRVVLLEGVHQRAIEQFVGEGFDVHAYPGAQSGDDLASLVADAHILGIRSKSRIDQAVLQQAGKLLAVGCFCIGTNQVDLDGAQRLGVPVFNSPFSNTRSVAELTIAEIIALHRRLGDRSRQMHDGRWIKSASGSHEVRGRVLGIVGYGRIGSQVSVLAEALGMHVIFHDVVPTLPLGNARRVESLDQLLAEADVVTLHVPATSETDGMMSRTRLGAMRDGAMLINNARGTVVDLDALADQLRAGRLAGAALDVFPHEPRASGEPFDSVLRNLDNVILTPHVGGSTMEAQAGIATDVASKLTRFINIGSTAGAVNVPEVDVPKQPDLAPDGEGRRPYRILHFHHNVPGVLGKMHKIIADCGANISAEVLRTNERVGYVVLDVDPTDAEPVLAGLRTISETIRLRVLW